MEPSDNELIEKWSKLVVERLRKQSFSYQTFIRLENLQITKYQADENARALDLLLRHELVVEEESVIGLQYKATDLCAKIVRNGGWITHQMDEAVKNADYEAAVELQNEKADLDLHNSRQTKKWYPWTSRISILGGGIGIISSIVTILGYNSVKNLEKRVNTIDSAVHSLNGKLEQVHADTSKHVSNSSVHDSTN